MRKFNKPTYMSVSYPLPGRRNIMNWYIRVYLVTQFWTPLFAYYHELSKIEITHEFKRNDSYFGFSITYDEKCKTLIVAAPRDTDVGEIYRCEITGTKKCTNNFFKRIDRSDINSVGYFHDFWFGASMKVGSSGVVACAPLFTKPWNAFKPPAVLTKGSCFMESTACVNSMTPMKKISYDELAIDKYQNLNLTIAETYSSLGWSIDIEPYSNTIVVGGPAMYTGRVAVFPSSSQGSLLHRPMGKEKLPIFNMGYSVAGVLRNGGLQYAVGSPYGSYGEGGVYFFDSHLDFLNERISQSKRVGSMFAAVLCTANIFGNKDDLLIGAPTYASHDTYNLGAVYIYEKSKEYRKMIVGPKDGSHFGSAIITLDDLNGDKRDEIAISAPHEDGRGAVYIYSGIEIANSENIRYLQKIQPKRYTSFGMSLATIKNYNNIGCNELAVGSPYDDVVVFYPCIPSIKVKVKAKFPNLKIRHGKTEFLFDACLDVTFPRDKKNNIIPNEIVADISTRVNMVHPQARLKDAGPNNVVEFKTSLNTQKAEFCTPISFTLPVDGNYNIKIGYTLTSHLVSDPRNMTFEKNRVMLNEHSVLSCQGFVSAAECVGACIPKLNLAFSDNSISSNPLSFTMSINNTGDVAYDACMTLVLPYKTISISPECVHVDPASSTDVIPLQEGDTLRCVPRKLLRDNTNWQLDRITLDNRHLTSLDRNVTILAYLFDDCSVNASKKYTHVIPVKGDPSGVNVSGETNIGEFVELTKPEVQKDGKMIEHHYTINNNGKTVWAQFNCILTLPKNDYVTYIFPVMLQYSDTSTNCSSAEDGSGFKVTCVVARLPPEETVKAIVAMQILPEKLEDIDVENVTVTSHATIHLDEVTRKASIVTVVTKMDDTVALWVIIVATIVGFLILCLIIFIFYKCGGFRRKNKENLHALRNSIRRQTIRRSMNLPKDDQKKIIENAQEKNVTAHT